MIPFRAVFDQSHFSPLSEESFGFEVFDGALGGDFSAFDDDDTVGEMTNDVFVVGYEDDGKSFFFGKAKEQIEKACMYGEVEPAGKFVREKDARSHGKGTRKRGAS